MGALYETLSAGQFWTLHAAVVAAGGVILLAIGARFSGAFAPVGPKDAAAAPI